MLGGNEWIFAWPSVMVSVPMACFIGRFALQLSKLEVRYASDEFYAMSYGSQRLLARD